jgi:hypothetical protein
LKLEYIAKFAIVFKTVSRCESVAKGEMIDEKVRVCKSCETVPLRLSIICYKTESNVRIYLLYAETGTGLVMNDV